MKNLKPLNLLYNFVVALILLVAFMGPTPTALAGAALIAPITGTILSKVKSNQHNFNPSLMMGLQVEIWRTHIEEALMADNTFLNFISDVDADNIINGKIVHIPQSGGGSLVQKNRTVVPGTVRKRNDGEVLYMIDEYTSDPVLITNADTKELSYDKRDSVLREELDNLGNETAEGTLENIIRSPVGTNQTLPTTSILVTNALGTTVPASAPGATGDVKAYERGDLQRLRNFFVKQKAWKNDQMYALLTTDAEAQMFPENSLVTATYMASVTEEERRMGVVYKAQGFKLLTRSSVYILNAAGAFKPYGSATATTDVEGILAWNKNMVEKALGTTEFFDDMGNPVYYGDIYSFLVRIGARAKRKNFEGVAVMKQTKV